jgi:hypothetical protein
MEVRRLECPRCSTGVDGRFSTGWVGRLSSEQLAFARVFLECRGKIKDAELRLGVSYPTVVARLDEIVKALGGPPSPLAASQRDHDASVRILEALAAGKITREDAAARLRALDADD